MGMINDKKLASLFKTGGVFKIIKPIHDEELAHYKLIYNSCRNVNIKAIMLFKQRQYAKGDEYHIYFNSPPAALIKGSVIRPFLMKREELDKFNVKNLPIIEEKIPLNFDLRDLPEFYTEEKVSRD